MTEEKYKDMFKKFRIHLLNQAYLKRWCADRCLDGMEACDDDSCLAKIILHMTMTINNWITARITDEIIDEYRWYSRFVKTRSEEEMSKNEKIERE